MRQVSVSVGASWQVVDISVPTARLSRHPSLVQVDVSVVAGQGDPQESGLKGYGGREGYARFIETKAGARPPMGDPRGAGQSGIGTRTRRRDGRRARRRLARRDAA